jgi:hypothetical protein
MRLAMTLDGGGRVGRVNETIDCAALVIEPVRAYFYAEPGLIFDVSLVAGRLPDPP